MNTAPGVGYSQIVYIQLRFYDSRSALFVPATEIISLSTTRPTRASVRVPVAASGWYNTTNVANLFDIVFTNPAGAAAISFGISVRITSTFLSSVDVSSAV